MDYQLGHLHGRLQRSKEVKAELRKDYRAAWHFFFDKMSFENEMVSDTIVSDTIVYFDSTNDLTS